MMRFRKWGVPFAMFQEDGGAGSGGTTPPEQPSDNPGTSPEAASSETQTEEQEPMEAPGYFSQLPGDKAKSEAYRSLYKYQKLDELADALIEANTKLEGMDRAIIVPKKGDTDGIKEFARKLGVPDEPGGYRMEDLADVEKTQPELVAAIRKGCRRMLLTERQGEAVGNMIASVDKANALREKLEIRDNIKHQQERVAALYKDVYPAEMDRTKAASEDIARYSSFLKETGLDELVNTSRLAGNPQMIKAIAAYARKHGGTVNPRGTSFAGEKKEPNTGMNYSEDWKKFKEGRR